jgi:2-dehydropantoate 2-reductase
MEILVYGAGVIGTLYATRLQQAGHRVTILARGSRLLGIQRHGLIIQDITTGARSTAQVAVTERLCGEEVYDLAVIAVRRDQLAGIVPDLAKSRNIPSVAFMLNNPLGSATFADVIKADRVLLGFPGAGGALEDGVVYHAMIAQQPTTVGEPAGRQTARLRALVSALRASGFPTRVENNMDAWLLCHAFFITCVCGAIYLAGGDCRRLSRTARYSDR